ncbi:sugar phosphate isomerase/epimerase family protein [Limosilactobacillus sp.]|jgi:sugar phosphate isomerase/epimerase|uniref:sugar phosphate isomerase/epimerase family protein n=1 Tax=Limosilactobacillus sp. TaxID=2773925 RepID=UPI0025C16DB9|nr:hypothetical protein [Limosilactobacillus sp.]MCH3922089.1 hypothetical protein [Limosilactobacillus sp.]MCH3928860.1 hypothetical protein [Limosilactobacillus sp.]
MSTFILNTIAFKKELDNGVSQSNFVSATHELGFDAIEIRQEYLHGNEEELTEINKLANQNGLQVYLSVNDDLLVNDSFNPKFADYLHMLKSLGSNHLKMNIGPLDKANTELIKSKLIDLLPSNCVLTLENNQTLEDSNFENTVKFFQLLNTTDVENIHYCFDIANWSWLDASAEKAAKALSPVTTYLHLKNVNNENGHLTVTSLDEGKLDWCQLIGLFSNVQEFGLEYSADLKTLSKDLGTLKQFLKK